MRTIDETRLSRFVDGDMSADQEAEILAWCEIEPDLWRPVALALVEHRRVTRALRELAYSPSRVTLTTQRDSKGSWRARLPAIAVIAASVLALVAGGAIVGYRAGQRQGVPGSESVATDAPVIVYVEPATRFTSTPEPPLAVAHSGPTPSLAEAVFPGEARTLLRDAGVYVEEESVLYLINGSDGERWAIPQTNFHLRYAQVDH